MNKATHYSRVKTAIAELEAFAGPQTLLQKANFLNKNDTLSARGKHWSKHSLHKYLQRREEEYG